MSILSSSAPNLEVISSGSLRLDIALRTGGYPHGSIVAINGPAASGKTTLCLCTALAAQHKGGLSAWIDTDHNFSSEFARRCGIHDQALYLCEPSCTEQAIDILETLAKSGAFSIIVLDSLHALTPAAELDGSLQKPADHINHEIIDYRLPAIHRAIQQNGTIILWTDQPSTRLSAVYHQLALNPQRLTLKLHTAIHLHLDPEKQIQRGEKLVGMNIRVRITKNEYIPCLYTTDFDIIYPYGINKSGEVFNLGLSLQLIHKQSEGYFYKNTCLGKTSQQVIDFFQCNLLQRNEVESKIRQELIPQNYNAAHHRN